MIPTSCQTERRDEKQKLIFASEESSEREYLSEKLNPIRAFVKKTDRIHEWSLVLKKELNESTEGGEVVFYNWNGKLTKVTSTHYGETYQKLVSYYLRNDSLIFVYEKSIQYNRSIYQDSARMRELNDTEVFDLDQALIQETESYFEHGQLIRSLNKEDCQAPHTLHYLKEEHARISKQFEILRRIYENY